MSDEQKSTGNVNISDTSDSEINAGNIITGHVEGDSVAGDKNIVTARTYIESATIRQTDQVTFLKWAISGLGILLTIIVIAGMGWFAFQINRVNSNNPAVVPNFAETETALREAVFATVTADALVREAITPDVIVENTDPLPTLISTSTKTTDSLPTVSPLATAVQPTAPADTPIVIEIEVKSTETGEDVSGAVAAVVGEAINALGQSGQSGVIKIEVGPSFQNYSAELIVSANGYETFSDVIDIVGRTIEVGLVPRQSQPINPHNINEITLLKRLEGQVGPILQVSFNSDGNLLASSGGNGTVNLWSVPDGQRLDTVQKGGAWVQGLSFSPVDNLFVTASDDFQIRLWRIGNDEPLVEVNSGHDDFIFNINFSPTSAFLVSVSGDGTAKIWNPENLTEMVTLDVSDTATYETTISSDGTRLATASIDGILRVWDVSTNLEICTFNTGESVLAVDFSPDDATLAMGTTNAEIIIIDASECNHSITLQGHKDNVNSVAYSPDGTLLASGSRDNTVKVWSLTSSSTNPITFMDHQTSIETVAFSLDSSVLASGDLVGTTILWGIPKNE